MGALSPFALRKQRYFRGAKGDNHGLYVVMASGYN
jgi:hypothetical protein